MNWQTLLEPSFSGRVCLTLVHSLWQAALLATIVAGLNRRWRGGSVERKYALHVVALVVSLLALPVTFTLIDFPPAVPSIGGQVGVEVAAPAMPVPQPGAESPRVPPQLPPSATDREMASSPAATPPASAVARSRPGWLPIASGLVGLYALGVGVMLVRLIVSVWQAQRLASRAQRLSEGPLVDRLQGLAHRWSMRLVPRLALVEEIVVPKVVGLVRPTILMPVSAMSGLALDELEMILAHELAHVRRYDIWVNLLQRVVEVVLFFNPAVWYLSHQAGVCREYCCDELACRAFGGSDAEHRTRYASVLLRIVEMAGLSGLRSEAATAGNLAALAAGRSPSELRRRVARLFGEPLREPVRFSRGSLLGLAVLFTAVLVTPTFWRSVAVSAGPPAADAGHPFELLVTGPDGKPVAEATVEFRTSPKLTAEQVRRGKFLQQRPYGTLVQCDRDGRLEVTFPVKPRSFSLSIEEPGFGPYWANWGTEENPQAIPQQFTAQLDAGWTVGGVIVNGEGSPVAGVEVHPRIKFKKPAGKLPELWVGTKVVTDAQGRWSYASVPDSMKEVFVEVQKPEFQPLRRALTRSEYGIEAGGEPKARLTLSRGLEVTGSVRDEAGQPIAGAIVRTQFLNDRRQATSGPDGTYRIVGCEPRMARMVVSAPGKARDFQDVRVEPGMKPVDFVLKPGGKVHVRVLDHEGKPVARTRIFFQRWRGRVERFEFDGVNEYTDARGEWQWNEAPLDEFKADICPPGGMQLVEQPLVAREEPYIFHLLPPLVISGNVTDAATGQPVKKFLVVPGIDSVDRLPWDRSERREATDGHYAYRPNRAYAAHLIRIEADGYQVAISRKIKSDEGQVQLDFQLQPAKDLAATVVTPSGEPAAGAKIALGITGSHIYVKNGAIDDGSTYAAQQIADAAGQFRFPAQGADFQLVITHPAGFAYLKSADDSLPGTIRLTAWARAEGTFRVARQAVPNVGIILNSNVVRSYSPEMPNIFTDYRVTTGPDGRFVFERVFPGQGSVGRHILLTVEDGATEATSSTRIPARFVAGETTTIDLGGTGSRVTGQLAPPADSQATVLWNFAIVDVGPDLPFPKAPPVPAEIEKDPQQRQAWWDQWKATEEGKAWKTAYELYNERRSSSPSIMATVDRNGAFHLDDVPAGHYVLRVHFSEHRAGQLLGHRFSVPEPTGAESPPSVDLGVLTLQSP